MKTLFTFISLLAGLALCAQTDTTLKRIEKAPAKYAWRSDTTFINVCRNDTVWLHDWQYDSVRYYVHQGLGMHWYTHGNHVDTILEIGKENYRFYDFHGWLRDWLCEWWNSSYYFIYYDTGELHMTFEERGEGHMGEYNEYYKNGVLKCRGSYCPEEVGARYGIWNWYDESGNVIRTKNYKGDKYCSGEKSGYRRFTFYRRKFDFF